MPWIRFSEPYNWVVPGRSGTVSILYKPRRYFVKREVADEAIAKGKAVEVLSPREEAAAKGAAKAAVKTPTEPSGRSRAATAAKRTSKVKGTDTTRLMATLEAATINYEDALAKQGTVTPKPQRTRKAAPDGESTV